MKRIFAAILLILLFSGCTRPGDEERGSIEIQPQMYGNADTPAGTFDDFWLTVTRSDGSGIASRRLGSDRMLSGLEPGSYTVTLSSHETYTMPAYNTPVRMAQVSKNVAPGGPTLFRIACSQINTELKFIFDETAALAYDNLTVKIEDANGESLTVAQTEQESKTACFAAPGKLSLSLSDGDSSVPIVGGASSEFDILPMQLWTITLKVSPQGDGIALSTLVDMDNGNGSSAGDVLGDGSAESPLSVAAAAKLLSRNNVWAEGYITGCLNNSDDNILIGARPDSPASECLRVELPAGSAVRKDLNIVGNPRFVGMRVAVLGSLAEADAGSGVLGKMVGTYAYSGNYFRDLKASVSYKFSDKVLKTSAKMPIGTAFTHHLQDPTYINIVRRDFDRVTSEYNMKMGAIWKARNKYDFSGADQIVNFAVRNGLEVHGHVLIWSQDTEIPEWLEQLELDRDGWIELMKEYITSVLTHFSGKVTSWDVVNEAFNDHDGKLRGTGDGDSSTFWYDKIGEDFIRIAFEHSREVLDTLGDTECKLFYNDYGFINENKRTNMLAFLKELIDDGVPVEGIGMQMHLEVRANKERVRAAFRDVADLGVLVHASEIDMLVNNPGFIAWAQQGHGSGPLIAGSYITMDELYYGKDGRNNFDLDYAQGKSFNTVVRAFLDIVPPARQFGITTWGITDKTSYVNQPSYTGFYDYAHTFGVYYNRKRGYDGILEGLNGVDWEVEEAKAWDWRWRNREYEPKAPWE